MSYTSPLEEESSSLTTRILLFDEIKIRLNDSKALVELDEIKRVLGWHRIEENEQLKKEIEQLTDALSDLEKAIGERNSREIKISSFINEKTQTQPSLQRKGQERGRRKGGGRRGGKEVIVSSESINTVVDPAFERGLLEAQIAFFVDRLRRHSSAPLVGSETSIKGLATIGEKHISSKRPQTATNRSIDEQLQVSTQKQSSSSSSSSSSLRSTFTNTNILISNEPSSDANLLPIRSAGSGSGVGVAISNSRPATGSSFASGGRSSSAGGSSYLSTGREALDSVGLLSPSSPSLLLNNPSSSGNIGGSRKLWDTDDIESRTAITALKAALQEETETLEQDVEWLHAQMEALMSSIDDEPTNLSSSSSSSSSIDQRHHREILEEAEAALISDGKEDLTALRVLKKDLQRTYLQSEECREITKTPLILSNKASSSSSSTQNRELEGQGVISTGLSNLSITGTNGSMSSKTTTISSTSLSSSSSSSSSSSVLSTDDQAAAARMRARRGLPTRLGTGSTTNMITTEGVKVKTISSSSDSSSLSLDDERFFS
jgi:hypothetical protein